MSDDKANLAVLRAFRTVEVLVISPLDGLSNKEISAATGNIPSTTTRDLATLIAAGWVQHTESGRYRLTAKPLGLCRAYTLALEHTQERITLMTQDIVAATPTLKEGAAL